MRLADALRILNQPSVADAPRRRVALACGFTPLHVETFLAAGTAERTGSPPEVTTGLFGDLLGTVGDVDPSKVDAVAVVLEWSDLDERLGYRGSHGWRADALVDVVATARQRLELLGDAVDRLAGVVPIALALPTLPLPPSFPTPAPGAAPEALELRRTLSAWATARAACPAVRVLDAEAIELRSPAALRLRLSSLLGTGFPYSLEHASVLGEALADALWPRTPLKGIITDLDDTLWRGVLGEDGIDGVSWSLEAGAHGHALYQELLASLAERGVLVAIVSKNDPELVAQALSERADLVLSSELVFPVEAGWGEKSIAVASVLAAWNVGADAVVFVDDSGMEREEVARAFPEMRCLEYPTNDDDALPGLLSALHHHFARPTVGDEDRLRRDSLRASYERTATGPPASVEDLLAEVDAHITFEVDACDQRVVELINKTNQFNLNGRRFDSSVKQDAVPGEFLLAVSYRDKFGPLGKIAVVHGRAVDAEAEIDVWVMSCRAFSRRIEHQTLRWLFEHTGARVLRFEYVDTDRNRVLRDFLEPLAEPTSEDGLRVDRERFEASCPALYASVDAA